MNSSMLLASSSSCSMTTCSTLSWQLELVSSAYKNQKINLS
jgi:hypothetical protein